MPHVPAYERDPRLARLDAEVVGAGDEEGTPFVVLSDTVLFPEGGGQPSDRGRVGGVDVLHVRKSPEGIRHLLSGPAPTGRVTVELDWARRFDHMQQHTAQHLLTAVADQRFGWPTTAFHMGDAVSDIELDTAAPGPERLAELEEAVAAEIRAARAVTTRRVEPGQVALLPVRTRGLPEGHTGSIRLVEIEGIDLNACGGTHLASTAEIEALKLLGTEPVRGGTRLFFAAGSRLRRLHEAHHRRNAELRALLGTSDEELVGRVAQKLEQLRGAERAVRGLEEELAAALAAALVAAPGRIVTAHWPERALPFLQVVAREAGRLAPDRVVFLTCGEGNEGSFLLASGEEAGLDVRDAGAALAGILGGRGGGSGRVFQGKATRLSRREEAAAHLAERA